MGRDRDERRRSTRDRERSRAEDNKYTGGSSYINLPEGVTFYKVVKGTNELDVIPYEVTKDVTVPISRSKDMDLEKGDLNPRRVIFVHRKVGADEKAYLCPRTIKKACPICEERARLAKDYKANEDICKELNPQVKELYNVKDAKLGKKAEIHLFEYSYASFGEKLDEEIREGNEDYAGYADLEGGYTLRARFVEESFAGNKYLKASRIDFEERDDIKESILEDVVDLEECLVVLPYDKLEAIFLQLDSEGSDDEDKPTKKKRHRDEEEEEDEKPTRKRHRDEDDEPPSRDRKRSSKKKEEEEEPEEKPRRSKSSKRVSKEDEAAIERGFESAEEMEELIEKVDQSSRKQKKAFEAWEEDEGTKDELLELDQIEDDEPEEKPKSRRSKDKEEEEPKRGKKKKDDGNECPYDHEYGIDCDDTDDCDKCEKWDECRDECDRLAKDKKKKK